MGTTRAQKGRLAFMKILLITGFDPFAHYQINPSWEAVRLLPEEIGGWRLEKLRLPNIYGLAWRLLRERAEAVRPGIILLTGMNSASTKVTVDCVAVNLRDALLEDNLGQKPWNEPVVPGAPAAYFATLPAHELALRLRQEGHPVHLAYSAGGFVCNDVFYAAAHHYAGTGVQVGFMHVPLLPQMVWDEGLALPLERSAAALRRAAELLTEWT